MRILLVMPHFFGSSKESSPNRSTMEAARLERLHALGHAICGPHRALGTGAYGLDHGEAKMWHSVGPETDIVDLMILTTGDSHLLGEMGGAKNLFQHVPTNAEPMLLGFEAHKMLRTARGRYDYYGFIEDDVVLTDPLFFRKRKFFDDQFGPDALLQPNRYEFSPGGPVHKLYVDYRLKAGVTAAYQDITDRASLAMDFLDSEVHFERPTYPSAGCFFLSAAQLDKWIGSPHFLDGDVSYLSPLDSAVTLSVMKTFRVYKSVLKQASFLEVMHASPRWIGSVRLSAKPVSDGKEESQA